MITFGSLFAGIGGLDLGLERCGWRCAWQVEISPWCRSVLARHWPDVPRLEDVRHVGRSNLAPVRAIVGGFPCQDVSGAGSGGGIEHGARSGLWREFARVIGELRPEIVVVENVAALLRWDRGGHRVISDLAACGYDAEWDVVSAAALGAPHLRERVWIVGWDASRVRVPDAHSLDVRKQRERQREQRRESGASEPAHDGTQGRMARLFTTDRAADSREHHVRYTWPESEVGRTADGLPARMDAKPWERGTPRACRPQTEDAEALTALGNAVCPANAEHVGRAINAWLETMEVVQ